jgi:hypothetical protein
VDRHCGSDAVEICASEPKYSSQSATTKLAQHKNSITEIELGSVTAFYVKKFHWTWQFIASQFDNHQMFYWPLHNSTDIFVHDSTSWSVIHILGIYGMQLVISAGDQWRVMLSRWAMYRRCQAYVLQWQITSPYILRMYGDVIWWRNARTSGYFQNRVPDRVMIRVPGIDLLNYRPQVPGTPGSRAPCSRAIRANVSQANMHWKQNSLWIWNGTCRVYLWYRNIRFIIRYRINVQPTTLLLRTVNWPAALADRRIHIHSCIRWVVTIGWANNSYWATHFWWGAGQIFFAKPSCPLCVAWVHTGWPESTLGKKRIIANQWRNCLEVCAGTRT